MRWDSDRVSGGVTVLPPYAESSGVKWYTGTASAIYQNLNYLSQYEPEYVLILSGDHIYKMDYSKMLDYHIEKESDVSISVIEVPWDEASGLALRIQMKKWRLLSLKRNHNFQEVILHQWESIFLIGQF